MAVPYSFATQTGSIPLSQLDSNFATAITLGNTAVVLGNTYSTIGNLTLSNVTISSGNVSINVSNVSTLNVVTLTVTGNETVGGNVTITGNVSVNVANVTTLNATSSTITGNETVGGNVTVTGNVSVNNATFSNSLTLSGGTANGVAYLNGSKVLTSGSALVFDGTNLSVGTTALSGGKFSTLADLTAANGLVIRDSATTYANNDNYVLLQNSTGGTVGGLTHPASQSLGVWGFDDIRFLTTTGASERMRIDSSGNVGIGTTSAAPLGGAAGVELTLKPAAADKYSNINLIGVRDVGGNQNGVISFWNNFSTLTRTSYISAINGSASNTDGQLTFGTASSGSLSERMRIDSSGNLLVGTTSQLSNGKTSIYQASNGCAIEAQIVGSGTAYAVMTARVNNTANLFHSFYYNTYSSSVGSISTNGTVTAYNTSSDYRLKENIVPLTGALDKITQLKPCVYNYKSKPEEAIEGFIAHEFQTVVPHAVTGEKDAVDAEGKPIYQGIDASFLIPHLVAAIQEQQALITNLTTRLEALEGK